MNAGAMSILEIFERKQRLEVPLFQRQYVWNLEHQWAPLWEDIARKFGQYLEGRKDAPVHFLGAMVLDQKQSPSTHVEKRQVIDGQQRLTTLQIFIAAFRDFCSANDCAELAVECETYTVNKGMKGDLTEAFKVWPTQLDRNQFECVITSRSRADIERAHPVMFRRRRPLPRPRMVEAYSYFYDRLVEFFIGTPDDPPLDGGRALTGRLDDCFQALKSALQVVVIDLDKDDDAQVIFETLNARGEPLLPADLLRNFIFLRAARSGESAEQLYADHWRGFDDPFWREEVRQGRLSRPRSDLFMQHFLASRLGTEIPIRHLFVEYKHWITRAKPFATIRDEMAALASQREHFRRIIAPSAGDCVHRLATFLECFDVRTAYPLLLRMLDLGMPDDQWPRVTRVLESYVLRRAICGLTTKNYNRVFLTLTRSLTPARLSADWLGGMLAGLEGESAEWPTDERFAEVWRTAHAYEVLQNAKLVWILMRLSDSYLGPGSERIAIQGTLTVEHLMPQSWQEHWPLPDGTKGLTYNEVWQAAADDPRLAGSRLRNAAVQTLGNLTILTQPLNSAVSNGPWSAKRPAILSTSLLPINQMLHRFDHWDESAISQRATELLERSLTLWPRPASRGG